LGDITLKHDPFPSDAPFVSESLFETRPFSLYARVGKPAFDILVSVALLPLLSVCSVVLLVLNPFFNRGPLLFVQPRMGRDCSAFSAIKFRTMVPAARITRQADDPLEQHRITPLGQILRKMRVDELPQIINVLRGEMSLIGPRPDYFHHARKYMRVVPGYRRRHSVRPGISGLAQTDLGYVESTEGTFLKVKLDLHYVDNLNPKMDAYVFWRTLVTVFGRRGC
jgi:lipopolysaccharide/colanic/teichoic acid biosynthesis glycosyltransferase